VSRFAVQLAAGGDHVPYHIDIEFSNRCNADCYFCPRDATPHEGVMKPEVFDKALARAIEFREHVGRIDPEQEVMLNMCGLGEPLINPRAADFVRAAREAGFTVALSSNGGLLDERRSTALLDAGLQMIHINAGERDEGYEEIYKMPFERTRDNIVRFLEMAEGRCDVYMVLVNHRADQEHLQQMEAYWRARGAKMFMKFDIINRGGSLFVDHMQFEKDPNLQRARAMLAGRDRQPACANPFVFAFIGYDGNYYLCCSDWKKEVSLASVHDTPIFEVTAGKLHHVTSREPVCRTCNVDPTNRLTELLGAVDAGHEPPEKVDELLAQLDLEALVAQGSLDKAVALGFPSVARRRRTIPVASA